MPIIKNLINLSSVIENDQSITKMTYKKKQSLKLDLQHKFQSMGFSKLACRCADCGTQLTFDKQQNFFDNNEHRLKLADANFCDNKFCPICSRNSSLKVALTVEQILEIVGNRYQPIFVTFTINNPKISRLKSSLKLIYQAFSRMIKTKRWKGSIVGFFRAIEYLGDDTPEGECHPHIHSILLVENDYFYKSSGKFIPTSEFVQMWRKALRVNYDPIVWVESVYDKMKEHNNLSANLASALEVAKYCTTFADLQKLSDEDFGYLYRATKGARLYAFGGVFKELKTQAMIDNQYEKSDEKKEWKTLETLYFEWFKNHYQLKSQNIYQDQESKADTLEQGLYSIQQNEL